MACFTLTGVQRGILAAAIINGMENVTDVDYDVLGPLIDELEAGEGSIEITVTADYPSNTDGTPMGGSDNGEVYDADGLLVTA